MSEVKAEQVMSLTPMEMLDELLELWNLWEHRLVPYVYGDIGIGKSAVYKDMLSIAATGNPDSDFEWQKNGYQTVGNFGFIDFRISQCEPSDIGGMPMPENGVTRQHLPLRLPTVEAAKKDFPDRGLLLIDEFNHGDEHQQKPMYSIINDGMISGVPLKKGWMIGAAGNPTSSSSHSYELGEPVKNRLIHYRMQADYDSFKNWAIRKKIHPAILIYLKNHLADLCKPGSNIPDENAFPTPRTWEKLSHRLTGFEKCKVPFSYGRYMRSFAGIVGTGTASSFCTFLESSTRFDIEKILATNEPYKFNPDTQEGAWVFSTALMSYVSRTHDENSVVNVIQYIIKSGVFDDIPEFDQKLLVDIEEHFKPYFKDAVGVLMNSANKEKFVRKLAPFLK